MPIRKLPPGRFPTLPAKDGPPGTKVNFVPTFQNYRDAAPTLDCVICDPPPDEDDGVGSIQKQGRWVVSNEGHDGFLLQCDVCETQFDRACFYPHEETMNSRQTATEGGRMASEVTVPAQATDAWKWGPFDR